MGINIPNEILIHNIFVFLPLKYLPTIFGVCKRWSRVSNDDNFWKNWIKLNQSQIVLPKPLDPIYFKPENRTWKWCAQIKRPIPKNQISTFTGFGSAKVNDIKFPGIASYEGEWKNGTFDGIGISYFRNRYITDNDHVSPIHAGGQDEQNAYIYMGDHLDGNGSGNGIMYTTLGIRYEGNIINGQLNGEGILEIPSDDMDSNFIYEGKFINGTAHGLGTAKWYGNIYVGEWINGKYEGKGKLTLGSMIYEGEFINGLPSGYGIIKNCNDVLFNIYNGFFDSSEKVIGYAIQPSGNKYIGEFYDDMMDGIGHFYWNNGNEYIGGFTKGTMDGYGKFIENHETSKHIISGWWNKNVLVDCSDPIPEEFAYKNAEGLDILSNIKTFLSSDEIIWKCKDDHVYSNENITEKFHPNIKMSIEKKICTYVFTKNNKHGQFLYKVQKPYEKSYYVCVVCAKNCINGDELKLKCEDMQFYGNMYCECGSDPMKNCCSFINQ